MALRLRRRLTAAAAVAGFVILAGATYQGAATALERRQFQHPGRHVPVGSRQLHIDCAGGGTPTVVLEAPAAGMSAAWAWVQPLVTESTRVCSYDRAGLGWSEAGDQAYDPAAVARDLRTLLEGAGEPAPYVIVGQGLGAAFARLDAAALEGDAAGLLLIDAPAANAGNGLPAPTLRLMRASPWLARAGILRATRMISDNATGLPEPAAGALRGFLNRPDHLTRAAQELRRWNETVALAGRTQLPRDLRVVQLTVGGGDRIAFLTDEREAERVSGAIRQLVEELRRPPPPRPVS
jgi:pimeloyl-ACP methyl ester carboxylesterase